MAAQMEGLQELNETLKKAAAEAAATGGGGGGGGGGATKGGTSTVPPRKQQAAKQLEGFGKRRSVPEMARHRQRVRAGKIGTGGIRRLARRAGVKRIARGVYEETEELARNILRRVLHDASVYTVYSRRKTLRVDDVVLAMKRHGITVYGIE